MFRVGVYVLTTTRHDLLKLFGPIVLEQSVGLIENCIPISVSLATTYRAALT